MDDYSLGGQRHAPGEEKHEEEMQRNERDTRTTPKHTETKTSMEGTEGKGVITAYLPHMLIHHSERDGRCLKVLVLAVFFF